jgi:hypothetical protein
MKRQFLALSLLATTTFGTVGTFSPARADFIREREPNEFVSPQVLPAMVADGTTFAEHRISGKASPTDPDVYRVEVAKNHRSSLTVSTSDNHPIYADLFYDANENSQVKPLEFVATTHSYRSRLTLEGMPAGTYFLKVYMYGPNSLYSYVLTWQTSSIPPRQAEVEPNDRPEQATIVPGCFVGSRYLKGSVNGSFDRKDYYRAKVCATQGASVVFHLLNVGPNSFLNLYHDRNGDGRINSGEFLENDISRGAGEIYLVRDLAPGEYIVEIVKPSGTGSADYLLDLRSE